MTQASTAVPAKGTRIQVEDPNTPGTFLDIANQKNANHTGPKMKGVETTHMLSAADENDPTMVGLGQFTADVQYNPTDAVHARLLADCYAGVKRNYRYTLTSGAYTEVTGWVADFPVDAKPADMLETKLVIQCTGGATFG